MSMFSWMFPSPKPAKPQPESSGLSREEATRPARSAKDGGPVDNAQPANRKSERMARRELLYSVVREAMTRAGVLSSGYKFKVLSLDPRGRQFLVMVDLARDHGGETARLAEIEALIAQAAKARHDILVTAVYWRMNEHVAVGDLGGRARPGDSQPIPLDSQPAALVSSPAPLEPAPARLQPQPVTRSRYEPIQPDEVAAFKEALASGVANPGAAAAAAVGVAHGATARAFDGSARHGPQSYTLLTGFEDTELPDQDQRTPSLSGTQYGDLR
jgi:hypothetical protein